MIEGLRALLSNLMQLMESYLSQLWATPDDQVLRDRIQKLIGEIQQMRERLLAAQLQEEARRAKEMADLAFQRLKDTEKKLEPKKPKGPGF